MPQYTESLQTIQGKLMRIRRHLTPDLATDFLNDAIATVLDRRPYWSGLFSRGVVSIPSPYTTGSVSLTNGSKTLTGTSTAWPVDDLVDTTSTRAVTQPGEHTIVPAATTNIDVDTLLFVDDGLFSEVVAVRELTNNGFKAVFRYAHSSGFTLQASSLAGRQLDLGDTYPISIVRAVKSATEIELDVAWGGDALSDVTYSIGRYLYPLANDLKHVLLMVDPSTGHKIRTHVSQMEAYARDVQRSAGGDPCMLVDYGPSEAGNMLYEIYPHPTSARQLAFLYHRQWPKLRASHDRLPDFINPAIFGYGALAQAFAIKLHDDDTSMNPVTAAYYDKKFENGIADAIYADNTKVQQALTHEFSDFGGYGANYWQSHDPDVMAGLV